MANTHRGEVSVDLAGKSYTLRLTINELCEAESILGMSVAEITQAMGRVSVVRALLWAGLQERHKGITLKAAGEIVMDAGIAAASQAVSEALAAAFPKAEESGEAANENPQ